MLEIIVWWKAFQISNEMMVYSIQNIRQLIVILEEMKLETYLISHPR